MILNVLFYSSAVMTISQNLSLIPPWLFWTTLTPLVFKCILDLFANTSYWFSLLDFGGVFFCQHVTSLSCGPHSNSWKLVCVRLGLGYTQVHQRASM